MQRWKLRPAKNYFHVDFFLLESVHIMLSVFMILFMKIYIFCQNFYLELRKRHQTRDSTPITTRQLESLIRLTEARARLELREEATAKDAEEVVEIMKYR